MITVKMEKQCGCFKKSDFQDEQTFETKEEALKEALAMCEDMNDTFCQKHNFTVFEDGDTMMIKVDMN
ncbi:MAG: hypothetical protein PHF17_03570 [Arcobacteraceae bacterium]|jgi:hypothetical protein|nr:hypothetical protein [Arcobacteraceae bacterium]